MVPPTRPTIVFAAIIISIALIFAIIIIVAYNRHVSPIEVTKVSPRHASETRWNLRGPRPPPDPDSNSKIRFIVALMALRLTSAYRIPLTVNSPSPFSFKMSDPFKSAFTPNDGDNLGPILNLDNAVLRAESDNTITPRQRTEGLAPPRPIRTEDGPQDPTLPTPTDSEGGTNTSEGDDGESTAGENTVNAETEGAHLPPGLVQLQEDELNRLVEQRAMALVAATETRRRQVEDEEQAKKELILLVASAVRETLQVEREKKPPCSDRKPAATVEEEGTVTINGMVIREMPRTKSEMVESIVHITKLDRFRMNPKDKEKLKSTACSAMKPPFQLMDYAKVLTRGADGADDGKDFGTQLLAQQCSLETFVNWAGSYDFTEIFKIPEKLTADQYSDPRVVANAPKIDLLSHYKSMTSEQVFAYQKFVKVHLSRADTESSAWIYDKLTASVEPNLLVQLKQTLGRRPEAEQGGISLFYLVITALDNNDYQNKKLITDYLSDLKLSDVKDEDVSVFASRFKAAAHALRLQDVPSDLIETLLKNVRECKNEDFAEIVRALSGSYHSTDHPDDNAARLEMMEFLCNKLVAKYRAFVKAKDWPASSTSSSGLTGGFKAEEDRDSSSLHRDGFVQPRPEWQAWWDSCTCKHCGKPHPTKYHNDQGARNRPYRPTHRGTPPKTARSPSNSDSKLPGFKSPADKKKYNETVHKAMLDYCLPCDESHPTVNVAAEEDDAEPDMFANVAEEDDKDDHDDDKEMEKAIALANMALHNLVTY